MPFFKAALCASLLSLITTPAMADLTIVYEHQIINPELQTIPKNAKLTPKLEAVLDKIALLRSREKTDPYAALMLGKKIHETHYYHDELDRWGVGSAVIISDGRSGKQTSFDRELKAYLVTDPSDDEEKPALPGQHGYAASVKVIPKNVSKTFAGHRADLFVVTTSDPKQPTRCEIWLAADLPGFDDQVDQINKQIAKETQRLPKRRPLCVIMKSGKITTTLRAVSVSNKAIPSDVFAVPEGYTNIKDANAKSDANAGIADTPNPVEQMKELPERLIAFADKGDLEAVTTALNAGANVNAKDSDDDTALLQAVLHRWPKVVSVLLSHGAKTEVTNSAGDMPLIAALKNGDVESVTALLEHGASPNPESDMETPLMAAGENLELLKLLLDHGANINGLDVTGWTALADAAQHNEHDVVKFLLDHKADSNLRLREEHETALMIAAQTGQDTIVQLLIDGGADIRIKDNEGKTAVDYAMLDDHVELANRLAQLLNGKPAKGVVKNVKPQSSPPSVRDLISAIADDNLSKAEDLVKRGANVNGHDDDGFIPLPYAVKAGNQAITEMLIKHGAYTNKPNHDGEMPISIAAKLGDLLTIEALLAHGAKVNLAAPATPPIVDAASARFPAIVKLLLDHGANIDARDHNGMSALCFAADTGDSDLVQYLLDHGANPNLTAINGDTPLILAASYGRSEIIPILLAHGAQIDAGASYGASALQEANDGFHPVTLKILTDAANKK